MKPNIPAGNPEASPTGEGRRQRGRKLVPLALLWTAGIIVWPGCATAPLPSSRRPAGNVPKADLAAVRKSLPPKSEVIAKLGAPDLEFPDLKIACYGLTHLSRHRICLFLGVLPIAVLEDNPGLQVVMFQYDCKGNTLRHTRRTVRNSYSMFYGSPRPYPKNGQPLQTSDFKDQLHKEAREWAREIR